MTLIDLRSPKVYWGGCNGTGEDIRYRLFQAGDCRGALKSVREATF